MAIELASRSGPRTRLMPAPPGGWAILLKVNAVDATADFRVDWTMKDIAYALGGGALIGGDADSDLGDHGFLQVPGGLTTATKTITVHEDDASDPGETIVLEAYYMGATPSLSDTLTLTILDVAPGARTPSSLPPPALPWPRAAVASP